METSDEDYVLYSLDHEPMDVDRDMPSVSPMACALSSLLTIWFR